MVNTSKEYYNLGSSNLIFHRLAKITQLPLPTYYEFQVSNTLLRCGFFENGYVVSSLLKRQFILINGVPAVYTYKPLYV